MGDKWINHDGSQESPVSDRTRVVVKLRSGYVSSAYGLMPPSMWDWRDIVAYRVVRP